MSSIAFEPADRRRLWLNMVESRECDAREVSLLRQGKGWFHIGSSGHEALAGLVPHLRAEDMLALHYRDRAILLARGVPISNVALGFFARRDSESCGKQMSSHFCACEQNVWSTPSPTPSHLLPACGLAWAMQLRGHSSIVLASLGDGGARQGEFFESICFAHERRLPIVFVVEDNSLAISTRTDQINPLALRVLSESKIIRLDGRDLQEVAHYGGQAISQARTGGGPTILWCQLDRLNPHTSNDDDSLYRPKTELETIRARDPVHGLARQLEQAGVLHAGEAESLVLETRERVKIAYQTAEAAPNPAQSDTMAEVLGPDPDATLPQLLASERTRIGDSVNAVFRRMLEANTKVVFFGEDIEDPKGGVFRLTRGLSTQFPGRVSNSPLAEATIVGVGCGLASAGLRPVFELQFIDFAGPSWNQLVNNVATLRWRTQGRWKCPLIIYAPCGAYLPAGGMWHSQCCGSALAQNPGLRVVMPSTPDDAAALFWTAFASEDPTVVLLPKHLVWKRTDSVTPDVPAVPFGKARLVSRGEEVTLVCWGNLVELAELAAQELSGAVSVEILDLRSLVPWDRNAIANSLAKTGRLLVVQEESESCSLGQMIITWVVSGPVWDSLLCRPLLVSRPDVPIGFNPVHEEHCLPNLAGIVTAAKLLKTL